MFAQRMILAMRERVQIPFLCMRPTYNSTTFGKPWIPALVAKTDGVAVCMGVLLPH